MSKKLRVTLVRSRIKADIRQSRVLDGLNLNKTNSSSELIDTPAIRGMIAKVNHLVSVEKV